ncbi:Aldo/keto reductase [Trichodelitschia bisporula]|uniref:Aldo/keto reductase n=1 Tax=Trichodelitschia bisporula TaxID=703511 RepID=A0A6G1HV84_9PEZI|nr:Aldo/keto reductase [Trichodelitschia bisporula]
MASPKTAVKVVFGAMTFGAEGKEQARTHDLAAAAEILDVLQAHGHSEVDTARTYAGGTSEEYLGQLDWRARGLTLATKISPRSGVWRHDGPGLREALRQSLSALKADKVDMWYLHAPDRSVAYEETLRVVDELHREGKFDRFGISNYAAWEVAQISEICIREGWIRPTAYQGVYNALHRAVEPELFPCLRKYGISFYEFNPLAGGYLTDRYHRDQEEVEAGSRFDPKRNQGANYRRRYWKSEYFDALDVLRPVAKRHGLTEAECALRWIQNHSLLSGEAGDAVIIGASSKEQLEENLVNMEKGPLPQEVLDALDEGWAKVKGVCASYFH